MQTRFLSNYVFPLCVLMLAGCDQQSSHLAKMNEQLQQRLDEKTSLLAASKNAEFDLKKENEKLGAELTLLKKSEASELSAEKVAAIIEPIIKNAIKESFQKAPAAAAPAEPQQPRAVPAREPNFELSPPKTTGNGGRPEAQRPIQARDNQVIPLNFDDESGTPARNQPRQNPPR